MSKNGRIKRVTDPLDNKVKARIIGCCGRSGDLRELGYVSSGSEHSAESISPSFSGFIFGFPDDVDVQSQPPENDSDSDSGDSVEDLPELIFQDHTDLFQNVLYSHVYKGLDVFSNINNNNKSLLRRNVMTCLRDFGYNAAICKAKWESSGGLTAGNYEYIDIIRTDSNNKQSRYLIDLDFAAEFEIARPTKYYERLIQSLPKVFVGKNDVLNQILRIMSDAARRSLKVRGLHLPPWRKYRFMHHKWLGNYKRTTNLIPSSTTVNSTVNLNQMYAVKCGFDAVNGGVWFPAVTRTR